MQDNTTKTADEANVIDLSVSTRKVFRIDGDNERLLSIDVSDMNVIARLEETYAQVEDLAKDAAERMSSVAVKSEEDDESLLSDVTAVLKDIDQKMREKVDYIFDADVSAKCAPKGNMYDVVNNGEWRFEHIIGIILNLYANNFTTEFKKMRDKVKKRTEKYVNDRTTVAPRKGRKKN